MTEREIRLLKNMFLALLAGAESVESDSEPEDTDKHFGIGTLEDARELRDQLGL